MKPFIILPLFFAIIAALPAQNKKESSLRYNVVLSEETLEALKSMLKEKHAKSDEEVDMIIKSSQANINDYVDQFLVKVGAGISAAGLDPVALPDENVNIGIGKSKLTQGSLLHLSTLTRYEDAIVSYDHDTEKLHVEFILRWEDLQFLYHYHTKVTLISISGNIDGNVKHAKIHLKVAFDILTGTLSVEDLDFKHTGDITVKFTGHKLTDWIMDAMSKVLTTIMHNSILNILRKEIMTPINDEVAKINQIIHDFFNPPQ